MSGEPEELDLGARLDELLDELHMPGEGPDPSAAPVVERPPSASPTKQPAPDSDTPPKDTGLSLDAIDQILNKPAPQQSAPLKEDAPEPPPAVGSPTPLSKDDLNSKLDGLLAKYSTPTDAEPPAPSLPTVATTPEPEPESDTGKQLSNDDLNSQLDGLLAEFSTPADTPPPPTEDAKPQTADDEPAALTSNEELGSELEGLLAQFSGDTAPPTAEAPASETQTASPPDPIEPGSPISNDDLGAELDDLLAKFSGETKPEPEPTPEEPATPPAAAAEPEPAAPPEPVEAGKLVSNDELGSELNDLLAQFSGEPEPEPTPEEPATPPAAAAEPEPAAPPEPVEAGKLVSNDELGSELNDLLAQFSGEPEPEPEQPAAPPAAIAEEPASPETPAAVGASGETLEEIDLILASQANESVGGEFDTEELPPETTSTVPPTSSDILDEELASIQAGTAQDEATTDQPTEQQTAPPEAQPTAVGFDSTANDVAKELDTQPQPAVVREDKPATTPSRWAERMAAASVRAKRLAADLRTLNNRTRKVCAVLSTPLAGLTPQTRDAVGYFALIHLFIGSVLIVGKVSGMI